MKKSEFAPGDLVAPTAKSGYILRDGSGYNYGHAVVVQAKPFMLCSTAGDMTWTSTVAPEMFEKTGVADISAVVNVSNRLHVTNPGLVEEFDKATNSIERYKALPSSRPFTSAPLAYNSPQRILQIPADLLEKLSYAAHRMDHQDESTAAQDILFEGFPKPAHFGNPRPQMSASKAASVTWDQATALLEKSNGQEYKGGTAQVVDIAHGEYQLAINVFDVNGTTLQAYAKESANENVAILGSSLFFVCDVEFDEEWDSDVVEEKGKCVELTLIRHWAPQPADIDGPPNPRAPEILAVLSLSTAHLEESSAKELDEPGPPGHTWADTIDGGYFCRVPEAGSTSESMFPEKVKPVLAFARSVGCTHIRFERDAPVAEGLETFDW